MRCCHALRSCYPSNEVHMLCALIQDNLVIGIVDMNDGLIQSIDSMFQQIIDVSSMVPQPQIGWSFDGTNILGSTVSVKITKLAMRQRFTFTELCALTSASETSLPVKVLLDNLSVATYIDLSRTDTRGGINLIASAGLITQLRADAILNTMPRVEEVYRE